MRAHMVLIKHLPNNKRFVVTRKSLLAELFIIAGKQHLNYFLYLRFMAGSHEGILKVVHRGRHAVNYNHRFLDILSLLIDIFVGISTRRR